MRRILLVTALAAAGLLAASGTASADVGDVRELSIDGPGLGGTANVVQVTGRIRCAQEMEYGLWVKVTQDPPDTDPIFGPDDPNASAEGVGAYGPNFAPEVGISDDNPCSQSSRGYDVIVQQSRDSGDFQTCNEMGCPSGPLGVMVVAGTSAENGDRGPGPFIGDSEYTTATVGFQRIR